MDVDEREYASYLMHKGGSGVRFDPVYAADLMRIFFLVDHRKSFG